MSLLDWLKAPKPSDLAHKRKIACNPHKGKKRSCRRDCEHPEVCNPVHPDKQLFCRACREDLSLISSVVNNHVKIPGREEVVNCKGVNKIDTAEALMASN